MISAVPKLVEMVGVSRIIEGKTVPCVIGDTSLTKEDEIKLRRSYILKALELLQTETSGQPKAVKLLDAVYHS
jgi:hypothetical protein